MKRLMISGFAAIALLAAATTMLRSHSLRANRAAETTGTMSLQEHRTSGEANKLPIEDFEDMSVVYSTGTKR
jgi:hypothetical protein